jgi:hypothetical protein
MIAGRTFWVWVWTGIMALGALGLAPALQWAHRHHWHNLDEVLRGVGTILVSGGMLVLLLTARNLLGLALLVLALACFVGAFIVGRRQEEGETAGRER